VVDLRMSLLSLKASAETRLGRKLSAIRQGACVLFVWLLLAPAPITAQVVVEDLEVHLTVRAGDSQNLSAVVPIRNELEHAQQVRITLEDWSRDSVGANVFHPYKSMPGSCGDRLQVFPADLRIDARSQQSMRVVYTPAPSDTGCWAIAFIESVNAPKPNPTTEGSHLIVDVRTGVKVYVHREREVRAGILEDALVDAFWRRREATSGWRDTVAVHEAHTRFTNSGTAHLRVKSKIEIRDADAKLIRADEGGEYYMLPGAQVTMRFTLPTLPKGDYIAIILLDFGGDEISAAQVEFAVP